MNAATEFDVGPLTWVKSEIDLALERAVQALQQFTALIISATQSGRCFLICHSQNRKTLQPDSSSCRL